MRPVKEFVVELLAQLPDDCTMEEVMYHLYVRDRIERGLKSIENGDVLTQEEVEQRMQEKLAKWRESSGPSTPRTTMKPSANT